MKNQIVCICIRIVMVGRPWVIVDGPNAYTDNYCLKHDVRQCLECKKEQETCQKHDEHWCKDCRKKMTKDELLRRTANGQLVVNTGHQNWDRTLDIKRLLEVEKAIRNKGYRPLIFVLENTIEYMDNTKEKYPEVIPKIEIIDGLKERRCYIPFEPHKPPGAKKSDDPNWDDDLWIINTAIQLEEAEQAKCYIMSNDNFKTYSDKKKKYIEFPWSWEKIRRRQIKYSWQPEVSPRSEVQKLVSPKLIKMTQLEHSIENEYNFLSSRIDLLQIELKELNEQKNNLSSQIGLREEIPKILQPSEEKELSKSLENYKNEICTAIGWVLKNRMNEKGFITTADIWGSIARKIKGVRGDSLISLVSELSNIIHYDENEFLKVELGYNNNTNVISIVEDAILIYQIIKGVELKFTPDQTKLKVMK